MPGIEANVYLAVKGELSKMTIAAAYIQGWGGQVEVLIIFRFHTPHEGTEVGQVAEMEKEEVFFLVD